MVFDKDDSGQERNDKMMEGQMITRKCMSTKLAMKLQEKSLAATGNMKNLKNFANNVEFC